MDHRHDIYGPIHKALRLQMTHALTRMGAVDVADEQDLSEALDALERLIAISRVHLAHEDRHVHPLLEAAQPGSATQAGREHQEHREELDALAGDLRALRSAAAHDRERLARQIYRALGRFVADNLVHMAHEEKAHNGVLWSHHTDAELHALEGRIVADTDPATLQLVLAAMLPALHPSERSAMVKGMQAGMPACAFEQVLDLARHVLSTRAWAALARMLGRPPHPGLMTA